MAEVITASSISPVRQSILFRWNKLYRVAATRRICPLICSAYLGEKNHASIYTIMMLGLYVGWTNQTKGHPWMPKSQAGPALYQNTRRML